MNAGLSTATVDAIGAGAARGPRIAAARPLPGTDRDLLRRVHSRRRGCGSARPARKTVRSVYLPLCRVRQRFPLSMRSTGRHGPLTASAVRFMTGLGHPQMRSSRRRSPIPSNRYADPAEYGHGHPDVSGVPHELIPAVERRSAHNLSVSSSVIRGAVHLHDDRTPSGLSWYRLDAPLSGFPESGAHGATEVISKSKGTGGRLVTIENLYGWKRIGRPHRSRIEALWGPGGDQGRDPRDNGLQRRL
jgi:hypothetical protein